MASWKVTEQAVEALQSLSSKLSEQAVKISKESQVLMSCYEENREGLGAHAGSIGSLLDEMCLVEREGDRALKKLHVKLERAASIRRKQLDTNNYASKSNSSKMTINGRTQTFSGTKSGVAKAYRTALKNGDTELAAQASQMFSEMTKSGVLPAGGASAPLHARRERVGNDAANEGNVNLERSGNNDCLAATMMVDHLVGRADFGKLDIRTAQDIYQSVSETIEMFPDMDLRFVGSVQSRNEYIDKSLEEMYLNAYRKHYPTASDEELMPFVRQQVSEDMKGLQPGEWTIAQSLFVETPQTNAEDLIARFNGISINESCGGDYNHFVEVKKSDVTAKWKPIGCDTPRATVDHELGHQIAKLTDAHNDDYIQKLYGDFMLLDYSRRGEVLSGYAGVSIHEFIAEGWSEYRNNPNCRPLALDIANHIIELYGQRTLRITKVRR